MGDGEEERPHDRRDKAAPSMGHPVYAAPVRGTQSFVYTLTACWKRPSLTALEVAWRWVYGIPALAAIWYEGGRILAETPVNVAALKAMTVFDPVGASATLAQAADVLMPAMLRAAAWMGPVLVMVWVVVSSVGRTVVLRRADRGLRARVGTVMVLQAVRVAALAGSFVVWLWCLRGAADYAVKGPIAAGGEPNLVMYFALAIVATLGLFVLWAVASWALSVAPLLAMQRDLGAGASLQAAFHLGSVRGKLVEINLVMGIVKIALIVLAMVASSCPLPFESVATPEFMAWWYVGVTVVYFVASDFFHVVRMMAYLEMWRVYDEGGASRMG